MDKTRFILRGGPCGGQYVYLPTYWDGYAYRPPEIAEGLPRKPLPKMIDVVPVMEQVTPVIYHRHDFINGSNRWFEFHPEPQDT